MPLRAQLRTRDLPPRQAALEAKARLAGAGGVAAIGGGGAVGNQSGGGEILF